MTDSLVVLTDFYAVTNRALSYAAGLAVPLRAHLLLLHVHHDALLAPFAHGSPGAHIRQELKTTVALQSLAAGQPVVTEVDISDGGLADAVREAVAQRHPLLLVLARPDPAVASEDLVMRTARQLLRHAPYPLLLVPAAGWDEFPPRRLLLAVDGEPFRLRPHQDLLRRLLSVGPNGDGTLDLVHVSTAGGAQPGPVALLETVRDNDLVDELPEGRLHVVYQPTAAAGILAEASRQQADMLVVVARPHSWLGGVFHESVTAQLLRESDIPVLVLPAEK